MAIVSLALAVNASDYMRVETIYGRGLNYDVKHVAKIEYVDFLISDISGTVDNYAYVDLGLKSGTLWATMNLDSESDWLGAIGSYFAWGETNKKDAYSYSTYKWCTVDANGDLDEYTKYNNDDTYKVVDNKSVLELADDAANYFCGEQWSLPTKEDFEELYYGCTWSWVPDYKGRAGYLGRSEVNGNTIFFPACGEKDGKEIKTFNKQGGYWTSSHDEKITDNAMCFVFSYNTIKIGTSRRYKGLSVRPIRRPATVSGKLGTYTYVDLGLSVKWATRNVGAADETAFGSCLTWGVTGQVNDACSWSTYKWCTVDAEGKLEKLTKYNNYFLDDYGTPDNKSVLELADDAANYYCGTGWRMPTKDEFQELVDGCDWEWVDDFHGSGISGRWGTSKKNGNTIFFPAGGMKSPTLMNTNIYGCYWTSSLYDKGPLKAYRLLFNDEYIKIDYSTRCNGMSIRAVCE